MAKKNAPQKVEDGFARVAGPDVDCSCSWGGETYSTDGDGYVVVPQEALPDLVSHGFVHVPESAD